MNFVWLDYQPKTMEYVEKWLDADAVATTGMDEGFRSFYEYWVNEDGFILGQNFWCKIVCADNEPLAVVALNMYEEKVTVMEIVVAPEKRCHGLGSRILKELMQNEQILGFTISTSEAAIYPNNVASQKAFENAGFRYDRTHEDGDTLYYLYERS